MLVLLLPGFLLFLFWNQSSHIDALYTANSKSVLISMQTGDAVQLEKNLNGYQSEKAVYGYDLYDRDSNALSTYRNKNAPFLIFKKDISIHGSDGTTWGSLQVFWTLPWKLLIYFILGALAVVCTVAIVVYSAWGHFSRKLILSIEQMSTFFSQKEVPEFILSIDELRTVFEKLHSLQQQAIEGEKFKAQREKDKEIVRLSQKVAHDIRSPMSALSLVLRMIQLEPEQKRLVEAALKRMSEICEDLLHERKKIPQKNESICQAVEGIVKESAIRFKDRLIEINLHETASRESVPDNDFKSVLSNLLNNALEATSSHNGIVRIQSESKGKAVAIKISDNGHGIPPEVLSELGRKPITYGKGAQGNGLGFYNAHKWAQGHGGGITIQSKLGSGTEVNIQLPLIG